MNREQIAFCAMATAAVIFVLWISVAFYHADEDRERRLPIRQEKAEAWIRNNHISATATCFSWSSECDIVPHDARAPFSIDCAGDLPCNVVR